MALKRRLVVAVVTASSLLCVYVLRGHLERPASWSTPPLKHSPRLSGSGSPAPQEPPHNETSADLRPRPPAAQPVLTAASTTKTRLKPADTSDPGVSDATSRSKGGDRARTKGPPALPRQQLVRADGPTDPPFIGDAYRSEDVPLQTDCRDGIRARVKKTAFGGRFLDHIPVLQWAADVTLEEHRRLSRYPGAHGWGGVDYGTLVETLSVLNASANRLLLDDWNHRGNASACSRCAVVGNGGILKESKMGEEIDGHHYVFRTNGAIVKGFEQDVGSRTTHYTFSTNTLMNSLRSYVGFGAPPQSPETRYVFLPDHDRDFLLMKAAATHRLVERGRERAKDPTEYFGADVSAEKLKMLHPDFIRYLRNRFLRSSTLTTQYKALYRPSTGAVMLLAALHACDQVSAYGFMTPDYSNYSDHYYDKSYRPVGFFINHDLRLEMALWQQLQQEGLIRLYMHR